MTLQRRRLDRRRLAATALLVTALAATGCAGRATAAQGLNPGGFQSGDGVAKVIPLGGRPALPALNGQDLRGGRVSTASYRGKVLVLNFWASWCAPCTAEAPTLAQLATDLSPVGVRFLGVNFRNDDRANARAFEQRFAVRYPSLYDPASRLVLQFPPAVRPVAIPTTEVVDRRGNVAAVIYGGPVLYTELDSLIRRIAAERT